MSDFSQHNKNFYEKSGLEWIHELASIKGLDRNEDLEALKSDLEVILKCPSCRLLEVGAGYGRVACWLVRYFPKLSYTGIDLSSKSVQYCRKEFSSYLNLHFRKENVLNLKKREQYGVALWLWAGLLEVSNDGKERALKNIWNQLAEGGTLVLELPGKICGTEKIVYNGSIVEQHSSFGFLKNELIHDDALDSLITKTGFKFLKKKSYQTGKRYPRFFLHLKKA